jgi:O-antigen ligase
MLSLKKVNFFLLLGFVFTLSFNLQLSFTNAKINNVLFILLAASTLLFAVLAKNEKKREFNPVLLLFVLPYIVFLFSIFYTDNIKVAVSDLTETKIGLFAIPFLFYFFPVLSSKQIKTTLLTFVVSCLVTAVYCLSIAIHKYINEEGVFLTYHELSLLAGMHAIYLAMFYSLSIIILLYYAGSFQTNRLRKLFFYSALIIFVISIFLLAARTHIFLLIAGSIGYFTYLFNKKNNLVSSLLKAFMIGIVFIAVVFLFPQNRERFKQLINYKGEYGINSKWGEQQMRPLIWSCAFQLISREPVFGYGLGDVQDELHQCYIVNEYTSLTYFEKTGTRFNAHNQYLEMMLGCGIFGLLAFLAMLCVPMLYAFKHKNILYFFFLLLFALSCITESFFERHNGIAFYTFFNSFLFFNDSKQNKDT